jgi:hypothetical protein
VAKRGRPLGATSRWRNINHFAAHHAQGLMEVWLGDAPMLGIRVLLSSLAGNPEYQALIEECWSKRGNERRYTVPQGIKRKLCRLAVAHVKELRLDSIQRRRAQAAETALRTQGWDDRQIAQILSRRGAEPIYFKGPDLEKVLKIVNRRAPAITLRRKSSAQSASCAPSRKPRRF